LQKKLFSVRKEAEDEGGKQVKEPNAVWAHKIRGFPLGAMDETEFLDDDLKVFPLGVMTDYKKEIASASTKFQQVNIYDVLRPNVQSMEAYQNSLKKDGSYESLNPELFEPDRIVFLDGVMQSRRSGEAAYHETLIQPSMFAHKNPKRVAIIGGGEGATLREVLKHATVEKVIMIEIDKVMVDLSRKYLPSWNDCSMLLGSAPSCFDDDRVEVQYVDAFKWFINNFPHDGPPLVDPFDVIIMDALDPQVRKDFVNALYDDGPFLQSIPNALHGSGIFISQIGESSHLDDTAEKLSNDVNRLRLINSLVKLGFTSIRSYTDNLHSGFFYPWQFVTAFKSNETKADWFANPSLVDLKIRKRSIPTIDEGSPFKYFDGPTMQTFYFPSKQIAVIYCRDNPNSKDCKEGHGFDPERLNLPLSTLEVRQSSIGEQVGRGIFARVDIPRESYVGLEKLIPFVSGDPHTYDIILKLYNLTDYDWGSALDTYIQGYGEISSYSGKSSFQVESTIQVFTNHACNADNNIGYKLTASQKNANLEEVTRETIEKYDGQEYVYNPAADRQVRFYARAAPLRDISQDEELLDCGKSST